MSSPHTTPTLSVAAAALWAAAFDRSHTDRRHIQGIPQRIDDLVPQSLRYADDSPRSRWVTLEEAWAELQAAGLIEGTPEAWKPIRRAWQHAVVPPRTGARRRARTARGGQ